MAKKSKRNQNNKKSKNKTVSKNNTILKNPYVIRDNPSFDIQNKHTIIDADIVKNEDPNDFELLDHVHYQWQSGDWRGLAKLDLDTLLSHPERAKLALLVASGHLQLGDIAKARPLVRLAIKWGVNKNLLSQILIAGVYNTLGKVANYMANNEKAWAYFRDSLALVEPHSDLQLITMIRADKQSFIEQPLSTIESDSSYSMNEYTKNNSQTSIPSNTLLEEAHIAWVEGNWSRLVKFDNAELQTYQQRAKLVLYAATGYQQLNDKIGLERCTKLALEWGCNNQQVKEMLRAGIYNTLGIINSLGAEYKQAHKNFVASLTIFNNTPDKKAIRRRIKNQLSGIENIDSQKILKAIMAQN